MTNTDVLLLTRAATSCPCINSCSRLHLDTPPPSGERQNNSMYIISYQNLIVLAAQHNSIKAQAREGQGHADSKVCPWQPLCEPLPCKTTARYAVLMHDAPCIDHHKMSHAAVHVRVMCQPCHKTTAGACVTLPPGQMCECVLPLTALSRPPGLLMHAWCSAAAPQQAVQGPAGRASRLCHRWLKCSRPDCTYT